MAAMVGPVGVKDPDLRHGRIPALFLLIILLDMTEILEGHGQTQRVIKLLQVFLVKICEIGEDTDIFRILIFHDQSFR